MSRFGRKAATASTYFNKEVALNELDGANYSDTGTVTSVSDSASSVTLLSALATRKGFKIFNDSTAILYIKYGATASTSSFTVRLTPYGIHESNPPHYTGLIAGIWASAAGGNARITELT